MKKAVIIIARNEKDWPAKTANSFHDAMPDAEIVGVDDGGENDWPAFVNVYKTTGGIGVGQCRNKGAKMTDADLVCFTDGHVLYESGDINKAWSLAEQGYVVNPSTMSMINDKVHGCGRQHQLPSHHATYVRAQEGTLVGMIGSVYFMKRSTALEIVAPTSSHGFNEQIMTCAALTFGHKTYAFPSLIFRHMFKKRFDNYKVSYTQQQKNRLLLDWWFFGKSIPANATNDEKYYYKFAQEKRKLSPSELRNNILEMNFNMKKNAKERT